jgi:hypothetical protein
MTQITIHQPDFLPWLGFFNKVSLCDILVLGDHVQYEDGGFRNRNKIKTANGPQWLTVPVSNKFGTPINKVPISYAERNGRLWSDVHLKTLERSYSRSKYFDSVYSIIEGAYQKKYEFLADLNVELLKRVLEFLNLNIPIKRTSELNLNASKTESIVEICKTLKADSYVSGPGGKNYVDYPLIERSEITILFPKYEHPTYTQQYMKLGFLSHMSIIDLLFNEGPSSLSIIKSGFTGFE